MLELYSSWGCAGTLNFLLFEIEFGGALCFNAFIPLRIMSHCLKWRDRLIGALRELEVGRAEDAAVDQVSEVNGRVEGKDDLPNLQVCVLFPC